MRGLLASVVAWMALTVAAVAGVDRAIESVARDVTANRPAPLSAGEVRTQLRVRAGTTTATAGAGIHRGAPSTTEPTSPSTGPRTTSPGRGGATETGPG